MSDPSVTGYLTSARAYLVEHGWVRGGRMGRGRAVSGPCCAAEAIDAGNLNGVVSVKADAMQALRAVVGGNVVSWNDKPERTAEDVFAAYDRAIAAIVPPVSRDCPTVPNLSRTACVFECRAADGSLGTGGTANCAWCRTHGFDCPELSRRPVMAARSAIEVLKRANDRGEVGYAHGGADIDWPFIKECERAGWIVYSHDASVGGDRDPHGKPFQKRDIYKITERGRAALAAESTNAP